MSLTGLDFKCFNNPCAEISYNEECDEFSTWLLLLQFLAVSASMKALNYHGCLDYHLQYLRNFMSYIIIFILKNLIFLKASSKGFKKTDLHGTEDNRYPAEGII